MRISNLDIESIISRAGIDIGHEKKVDLGVLRGADHDGRVPENERRLRDRLGVKKSTFLKVGRLGNPCNRSSAVDLLG